MVSKLKYGVIKSILMYITFFLIFGCTKDKSKQTTIEQTEIPKNTEKKIIDSIPDPNLKQIKKQSNTKKPKYIQKFSYRDLTFTWEDINACDCLFMVKDKNTDYKKLYFGRFKGDTSAIIQLGKNTEKQRIRITKPRSKTRKPGSAWIETYQNDRYKIKIKANPDQPKVKKKYTYYFNFTLTDLSSKKSIKNMVIANCKS